MSARSHSLGVQMIIGVLDDDSRICHILETVLAMADHSVYAYTDPLAFLASVRPDVIDKYECIIVDFRLSEGKSGIEIIRQVRQTYPLLPAILISGDALSRAAIEELPNVVFCQKPFHLSTLLELIHMIQKS